MIARYDFTDSYGDCGIVPAEQGEYVLYSDIAPMLESLRIMTDYAQSCAEADKVPRRMEIWGQIKKARELLEKAKS